MICIYIIVKRHSEELYFPRRFNTIQNWTFLLNMLYCCLRFVQEQITHFFDLKICPYSLTIFWKNTYTGQYINMDFFTLLKWKSAWIRSLVDGTKKICSRENLPKELQLLKKFASWNSYPKNTANAIIKCVMSKRTLTNDVISNE